MPEYDYDVCVIGGGIAGLVAAYELRDYRLVLFEATDRVGGRMRTEPRGDYWLNFGAHVFGGPTSATGRLLSALGVDARAVPGRLAAVSLNVTRVLGFDEERTNVNGGSVALGHPIGMSGARIVLTLAHEMRRRGVDLGGATICGGGGQGDALVLRRPA